MFLSNCLCMLLIHLFVFLFRGLACVFLPPLRTSSRGRPVLPEGKPSRAILCVFLCFEFHLFVCLPFLFFCLVMPRSSNCFLKNIYRHRLCKCIYQDCWNKNLTKNYYKIADAKAETLQRYWYSRWCC